MIKKQSSGKVEQKIIYPTRPFEIDREYWFLHTVLCLKTRTEGA